MQIREARDGDWSSIWPIVREVVRRGDTYAYEPDLDEAGAHEIWMRVPQSTFVVEENGEVLGTYYLKSNQAGPGKHVCNCGYMVPDAARGKGLATAMCKHSQAVAVELGYRAMQFNFVAASNVGAIGLWQKLGFEVVGRLPQAFNHPEQGLVDALVMYKWLVAESVDGL